MSDNPTTIHQNADKRNLVHSEGGELGSHHISCTKSMICAATVMPKTLIGIQKK